MPIESPEITVKFPALGREFTSVVSYRLESDYFVSTDSFEIQLYHPDLEMTKGLELQPVEVFIDGASQLIGRVDVTEISDSRAVTIMGRDYLADLVECEVDPTLKILKGESVYLALQKVCWPVGIGTIVGDDDVLLRNVRTGKNVESGASPVAGFRSFQMQDLKPEPGQGIYEFCNQIAARHHATLQPGTTREQLVFTAPNYEQTPSYDLQVIDNSAATNVVTATARRDYQNVPTFAKFQGRGASKAQKHSALNVEYAVATYLAALNEGFFKDAGEQLIQRTASGRRLPDTQKTPKLPIGQLYRFLYMSDPKSRAQEELDSALRRAIGDRAKDTLVYTCTVRGHKDPRTKSVYAIDTIANVNDEIRRVNEALWIAGRVFNFNENDGPTTEMRMYRKRVIQL